ncbi:MAG: hypothetical protein AAF085_00625 [Planctomycetota bacterium]
MNLGVIITIIIVVAWVVRGIAAVMGDQDSAQKKRPGRSLEEWDEMQAERRAQLSDKQQTRTEARPETLAQNPAQMTMAERIELARQRARAQAGLAPQDSADSDTQRREQARAEQQARQQREAELQARRQRAEQERAAQQQRAQRERAQQQRRRQAQQEAEQQAQRQRRSRQQQRRTRPAKATTGSQREQAVSRSQQRVRQSRVQPAAAQQPPTTESGFSVQSLKKLDRKALKQAFIMKELLDKPIALRDPQSDLLS